jgi:hypothetical protein
MIKFGEYTFKEVDQFDCRVLSFWGGIDGQGIPLKGYSTVLPISPAEYRNSYPDSKASVEVYRKPNETAFFITDDLGHMHTVTLTNDHEEEIKAAIMSAVEEDLLSYYEHVGGED